LHLLLLGSIRSYTWTTDYNIYVDTLPWYCVLRLLHLLAEDVHVLLFAFFMTFVSLAYMTVAVALLDILTLVVEFDTTCLISASIIIVIPV